MIVLFVVGGGLDVFGCVIVSGFEEVIGFMVMVENCEGGFGVVGYLYFFV